ncbi:DUF58 domain-containing protein [Sphingomonas sp. 2R-10]|uniref:DUF58 domain-containing protein n=1 Tax=Sphingomonas sp. 2R-10 TaxID=3045148 RepID=UPI000F78CA30|nr:DUF58 domain-containing protein [Sphingomonas sp. 2R-10]MDJ0276420.1 DUF58 domain-containing protein [Sphingomonas sp. 2R-10]
MTVVPTFLDLFDPSFLARLDAFSLRVSQAQKGGRLADQRTFARGQGSDFADFKPYVAGDDLRTIDWNIYRRLGKTFVRVFEERQDLPVYVMTDVSRSMFVEPQPRIAAALRASLAIAAVALNQVDAVTLIDVAERIEVRARNLSGRQGIVRAAQMLAQTRPGGGTDLATACDMLATMKLRRGLVVVVSDFMDDAGIDAVTQAMGRLRHRLLLVQLVRRHDADPSLHPGLTGDVLIEDGEGGGVPLTVTPALLAAYRDAYAAFRARLDGFAGGRGAALVRLDADRDVLDQLSVVLAPGTLPL